MNVSVIVVTHGSAAKELLATKEMLIGKHKGVVSVDFLQGESVEALLGKYEEKVSGELSGYDATLFLVDVWGGSPFNAASRFAHEKDNVDVVTGVNVPMLVETCLALEDNLNLSELVSVAVNAGTEGVKSLKHQASTPKPKAKNEPEVAVANEEGNLVVAFARIDDRLIHGQVAMRWTKEANVSRIIVVNDDVAKDEVRAPMLKNAAPAGVSAHVVSVDKMIRVYNNPEYANQRVMLLFTNPTDVVRLVDAGLPLSNLNVGGMSYNEGRTMLNGYVSVNTKDVEAFSKLVANNVAIDVRKVSDDPMVNIMDLLKKHNLV